MKKRVVVSGGGLVSALGNDWESCLAGLKACKNFVRRMDEWDRYEKMNTRLAAPVDFIFPDLPRQKIRGMGRVARLAITAVDLALKQSNFSDSPELTNSRCGVSFGSSMGSVESLLDFYSMLVHDDIRKMTSTTYVKAMPQTCAANIAVFYGLTGRLISANTACTSGSQAIGYAFETIKNGIQDIMISGGAEELSAADSAVFDTLFAASCKNETPQLTPRAYDKNRDGLVIGEGAGCLILEEYEHAIKRGAKIYAEIAGFATNTDGTHITKPNRLTMASVMRSALDDAKISAENIAYINMHGTATQSGDEAESLATFDVFKDKVPVSTIKNYIGHTLGACGAIEAWLSINMMNEKWFAPNINFTQLDPACAELDYITADGRNIDGEYIMSNNFAFGGVNTSLIFKKIAV
ncbi:MAG: beta-ketoacyl-ACP synthase [Spirochaetaceae bacterium]|jgi:3-oxoacyl-[acyl-carrier-protein] synthase II|nr:beta-ketoacyl-ACP synthase [Spirochaetaceae bacterium]